MLCLGILIGGGISGSGIIPPIVDFPGSEPSSPVNTTETTADEETTTSESPVSNDIPDPPSTTTEELARTERAEQLLHEQVNHERFINQVNELEYSTKLAEVAASHSRDMAENGYFSHVDPMGRDISERYQDHGINCEGGENIFRVRSTGMGPESLVNQVMEAWMNSQRHRENILRKRFTREGIGVVYGNEYVYVTQNFC